MKKKNNLYYIVAGEASGDLHGSHLINALQSINPLITFRGIGGPRMNQSGFKSLADFHRLSVMGFLEIIKDLNFFIKLKKTIVNDILISKPQKIILIDYPGFNLKIVKALKAVSSIPIVYYISPQVWAWKENRVSIIKQQVDSLVVLFPFEKSWFKKRGVEVQYFGHPLIDLYYKQSIQTIKPANNIVGFFPGSRLQEIKKHTPVLLKIYYNLLKKNSQQKFVISLAPGLSSSCLGPFAQCKNMTIDTSDSLDVFNAVSVAVVASGTATLECAISQTPFVVIYKTSFISWLVAKLFLSIQFVSIVNILANKEIVKEYLQYQINVNEISNEIRSLLVRPNKQQKSLNKVTKLLGDGSAYMQTAKYINQI